MMNIIQSINNLFENFINNLFEEISYIGADKGTIGEWKIFKTIRNTEKGQYALRNIYLKKENGETTEIDLVFMDKKGIYVIESKNYSGSVYGDENHAQWTQFLYSKKNRFYNPIWQNNTHIRTLKNTLSEYQNIYYHSIIIFGNECKLKETCKKSSDPNTHVIHKRDFMHLLNSINKQYPDCLDETEIENIIKVLESRQANAEESKKHIDTIKENLIKCPFCKTTLIERSNKTTGEKFYGCRNYPTCKYTKPLP